MKKLKTKLILAAFIFAAVTQSVAQTHGAGVINTLNNVGIAGTAHCFIGDYAGNSNTGANNTFLGYHSGRLNVSQTDNVFVGYRAGYNNGSGDSEIKAIYNTFAGADCGYNNTTGGGNTFYGRRAGYTNTIGDANCYFGTHAGISSTGDANVFMGYLSGYSNSTASGNTFLGNQSGYSNTTAEYNVLIGQSAGHYNVTGQYNCITGFQAGQGVNGNSHSYNTFNGCYAGYGITTGGKNVLFGYNAGGANTTGANNVMLGYEAGLTNTSGSTNTIIGYAANVGSSALSNAAAIGANAIVKVSNDMILGDNNTDVGINLSNDATGPLSALSIGGSGNALWETYSYNPSIANGAAAIKGEIDATTSSGSGNKVYASVGYGNAYYGYTYGVYGVAYKSSAHSGGRAYGVYGVAGNCTNTFNYGVYGTISGSNSGFAGYFDGLLRTTNDSPEKFTGGSWVGYSDERLKQNIQPFEDGLDVIRQIDPVTYQFNGVGGIDPTETHIGVIAQDVSEVAPYCVGTSQLLVDQTDAGAFGGDVVMMINDSTPQAIVNVMNYNYDGLIYAMINAIKELDSTVTALQAQVDPGSGARMMQGDSSVPLAVQQVSLNNSKAVLYQNIPNPAQSQTTINYYVSENAATAQMVFYDEFGREIKRVELENKGNGSLDVNTVDLQSGIYSYSLIVDGGVIDTKQMIRTR